MLHTYVLVHIVNGRLGIEKRKEPFLSPSEVCTRQIFRLATTYNAKMRLRASATRDNATHLRPCSTTGQRNNHVQRQNDTQQPCLPTKRHATTMFSDKTTRNYHVQRQHDTQLPCLVTTRHATTMFSDNTTRNFHVQRQHDTQLPCDNMTRNYHVQRQHETTQKFVATNFCQHLPKWIEYALSKLAGTAASALGTYCTYVALSQQLFRLFIPILMRT